MTITYGPEVLIRIRNNATGEVRGRNEATHDGFSAEYGWYLWTDGDYACDCNRSLHFYRLQGEDGPDQECGDTAFSIQIFEPETDPELEGVVAWKLAYDEFDEDESS